MSTDTPERTPAHDGFTLLALAAARLIEIFLPLIKKPEDHEESSDGDQ